MPELELEYKGKMNAQEQFKQLAMPTEKNEAWRYTELNDVSFDAAVSDAGVEIAFSEADLEKGVIVLDLAGALKEQRDLVMRFLSKHVDQSDKFLQFCEGFFRQGKFVYVPQNVHLEKPILLRVKASGNHVVRNLIVGDEKSSFTVVEEHESSGSGMLFSLTEIHSLQEAKIKAIHLNQHSDEYMAFSHVINAISRDACVNSIEGSFGGKLNRLFVEAYFEGQGATAENTGVFLAKGREHIDISTNVRHLKPHTTSDVAVRGIGSEKSSSVYRGLIEIEKEAQATKSYLANNILKLSKECRTNSIPSLLIDANDVSASHSATFGEIDEEALFYLQSRGITKGQAEQLIVQGFFEPMLEKLPEDLKAKVGGLIETRYG